MGDLSQHKTLMPAKPTGTLPSWLGIGVRVLLLTFVGTLLSFAVSLLFAILGTIAVSWIRGIHPDLRIAYRDIALPIAVLGAGLILVAMMVTEVRDYRQRKTLQDIERIS